MELTFGGGLDTPPQPTAFAVEEMAQGFVRLCVDTIGDQLAVSLAAESDGMDVSITASPGSKNAEKGTMLIANGPGLVVTQTEQILEYDFTQCNVNYFPDALPETDDVANAMAVAIGRAPDNEADRFKKNGKPNKRFKPEWQLVLDNGSVYVLRFDIMKSNRYLKGNRVLFGLREVSEKN
jgi:hypothetical protein